ncbi:MAG: enoyl-CoA hydratase [Acidimicrobiaceae bacterium]|jgi:enoyl-CoA hydratase
MTLDVARHRSTALLTINRPDRRNALDGATIEAIGNALTEAEADDDVRVVVLTGAGDRSFCSGMDLKAFAEGDRPTGAGLHVLASRCYPKPVIAAVNGAAVGGGFELVLASDLVVAASHAVFSVPEVRRGVVSAGCSTRLAGRIPPAMVYELALVGDAIDARRAAALGLVNLVVDGSELLDRALDMADRIAENAPMAVRVTKFMIHDELRTHDAEEWAAIRAKAEPVFASNDAREGALAFVEKRAPRWTGR